MATPDIFYFWHQENTHGDHEPVSVKTDLFLEPYLKAHSMSKEDIGISESSEFADDPYPIIEKRFHFQNIIREWLTEIINRQSPGNNLPDFLDKSGLRERIAEGFIETDAFVPIEPYAAEEGEDARDKGLLLSANPYNPDTQANLHQSWIEGWEDMDRVYSEKRAAELSNL